VIVIRRDEGDDGDCDDIELFDASNFFQITFKCSSEQDAMRRQYKFYYYYYYYLLLLFYFILFFY